MCVWVSGSMGVGIESMLDRFAGCSVLHEALLMVTLNISCLLHQRGLYPGVISVLVSTFCNPLLLELIKINAFFWHLHLSTLYPMLPSSLPVSLKFSSPFQPSGLN